LDYLEYIDVKNMPTNMQYINDIATQGDLFGDLKPFGEFYKFDDGKKENTEETEENGVIGSNSSSRVLSDIPSGKELCRTHYMLDN
jgi:hypothetical protein